MYRFGFINFSPFRCSFHVIWFTCVEYCIHCVSVLFCYIEPLEVAVSIVVGDLFSLSILMDFSVFPFNLVFDCSWGPPTAWFWISWAGKLLCGIYSLSTRSWFRAFTRKTGKHMQSPVRPNPSSPLTRLCIQCMYSVQCVYWKAREEEIVSRRHLM